MNFVFPLEYKMQLVDRDNALIHRKVLIYEAVGNGCKHVFYKATNLSV